MPHYLVAIHHPDNDDPVLEGEAMIRDISALNEEMQAAGARFFAGGLESVDHAKSPRKQSGGQVVITDGPYIETKEHIGGFWILEAADIYIDAVRRIIWMDSRSGSDTRAAQ